MGLTYNRFHVTAVCSPTRAALLTGRNHHRVGMGTIAELPGPYPGYTGTRPRSCTALPRILKENGYVTGGFGKWHLTPGHEMGAAGPFDHWPMSWGFDHWWGFLTGAAGQYDPIITQDNSTLGVPEGEDGKLYYFPDDITDKAVEWLHAVRAQDAQKPWMLYYSTGCSHPPHHMAKQWADRYKGRFDQGWDRYREETLARQKQLGIVPSDTELTERPELFPAWDSLSDAEKQLYARQMEVFAGFRRTPTGTWAGCWTPSKRWVIWTTPSSSTSGATTGPAWRAPSPAPSTRRPSSTGSCSTPTSSWRSSTSSVASRRWAGSTPPPLRRGVGPCQQHPVSVGQADGQPPGRGPGPDGGRLAEPHPGRWELRSQFTHCIDIGPTVLELVGIPEPTVVDGIAQEPMDGTSFAYTLDDAGAEERHTVQYFKMLGSRAIYKDGWWACARLDKIPWDFTPETMRRFAPGA
jgi:arylsulfatase A-like enzyme